MTICIYWQSRQISKWKLVASLGWEMWFFFFFFYVTYILFHHTKTHIYLSKFLLLEFAFLNTHTYYSSVSKNILKISRPASIHYCIYIITTLLLAYLYNKLETFFFVINNYAMGEDYIYTKLYINSNFIHSHDIIQVQFTIFSPPIDMMHTENLTSMQQNQNWWLTLLCVN